MTRRVPFVPTIVVALAAAAMIALGVWQLGRKAEKDAQITRYARATAMSSAVPWPRTAEEREAALYRHSQVECVRVLGIAARAGRSFKGETGWAHLARCALPEGGEALVALGWSANPARVRWNGGAVGGVVGPAGEGVKLVAAPPQARLAPLAPPDPREMPNNHLSYAVQWFAFALTALVIYALALRGRWRANR